MNRTADYIPRKAALYDLWLMRLADYVAVKTAGETPQWTHIPAEEVAALGERASRWHEAFVAEAESPGPARTAAKRAERAASEAFVRSFVNRFLRYPPVTDADRAAMGIPNRKPSRSPVPQPAEPPDWTVRNEGFFKIRFDIRPAGEENPRIPKGYAGANIYYAVTSEPVYETGMLDRRGLLHKGISYMQFTHAEDGLYLSAALEWQTHSARFSPVSDVKSIKIR